MRGRIHEAPGETILRVFLLFCLVPFPNPRRGSFKAGPSGPALLVLFPQLSNFVHRYGKADILGVLDNGEIDADQLAFQVQEGASAVPGIYGGVGLQ